MAGVQEYTISHTGSVLDPDGDGLVERFQNQVSPQRETPILEFECPRKFEEIRYVGRRDPTRFIPRTVESITGSAGDDTVVSLTADIQPPHGETDPNDQDYPPVVAYNVDQGAEVAIDSVDYAANTVTLASDPADTETVKLWPIITEGSIQFEGVNQFNQVEGPVYNWETPVRKWHDFEQNKRGTEINLHGRIFWSRYERLRVTMDSPRQIVWEDSDYPRGAYVSTFEQDVEIQL